MKKILIIGISGCGKSTLAKQLSHLLKLPKFDLDDIFWIKKYSQKRDNNNCEKELKELLKRNNTWIIEGVYDWVKIAADQANLVIYLNYGINIATYRVIKRWFGRKGENKETIKGLYHLIRYIRAYKKVRSNKIYSTYEKHQKVISRNKHNLVEIRNKKELKELLERLQNI